MLDRLSGAYALLQVSEDEQIVNELRGTVVGVTTAIIAGLSAVISVLFFVHAFGWVEFLTFESVSTRVQLNTSIGLAVFAVTTAAASFFQRGAASLNVARFLTLLLSLLVVNYLPAVILDYAFPQLLWLPILFAAATVSGRWAAATAVIVFAGVAYRFPEAPVFRNPASLSVTVGVLALVLALRWLFDAGLRAAAKSHQRVLTTLRVDSLTGLPNRTRLMELLTEQGAVGGYTGTAIARFDIDGFGAICDAVGATAADELLVDIANELRSSFGPSLRAARIGADDFALILPAASGIGEAELRTEELLVRLGKPRAFGGRNLRLTLKAGVAMGSDALFESAEAILQRADLALTEAKRSGQRIVVSLPTTNADAPTGRAFEIAQTIFGAAERGEMFVAYQPIVELASGRHIKAEALVRWNHPEFGSVSPAEFIAISEQVGAIHEIGDWVALEAARFAAHIRANLEPAFQMSINRSPVQFRADGDREPNCVAQFRALGLDKGAIIIEITEGVLLDGREANRARLADLRASGIGLALDDFGTGYASLAQLHAFEIDIVKIDRRFVSGLAEGNREHALCAGIISLAHSLGMTVVAEGVETPEQRDLLLGLRCDFGQGWLFGRPVTADAFEAALRKQQNG
jgi:diguanylate cyclase (GGDEF)-like protein